MGPITLVCGPPCAGKTTLVDRIAKSDDLVLDFDRIAVLLGSPRRWLHPPEFVSAVERQMAAQLAERGDAPAWVIRAAPRAAARERLAASLPARVWLLDPGLRECLVRARRRPHPQLTAIEIRKWYRIYVPSPIDEVPNP